ncbi:MAG TPA: right-handed parallel beta-helix repeat-containing protein, partial [Chthoniobacterales bacterium]
MLWLGLALAIAAVAIAAPAAIVPVFNTNDAFAGSLRQAIQDAPPGSTIVFQIPTSDPRYATASDRYLVTLTSASLIINKSLTIDGGTQKITIQRSFAGGTPNFQLFKISGGPVTLANLTFLNGSAVGTLESGGGAIYNLGALTVRNCTFLNNLGGGIAGGIYSVNPANLVVSNCTFVGNTGFQVGAISNDSIMAIDNSTFTGNQSQNSSVGAIRNTNAASPIQIRNTIVVGNTGNNGGVPSDVGGAFSSGGYNLVGPLGATTGFGATGDQIGVSPAAVNLSSLQDNGGPTVTARPNPGSLAIDQGNRGTDSSGQSINTDQRGSPRPVDLATANAFGGDGSDIGAVETGAGQAGPTFTVTNTAEHVDANCTMDNCTLVDALNSSNVNADANTIVFAPGLRGVITTNLVTPSGLAITKPVTIIGPGARVLAVSGQGSARVFRLIAAVEATISGLTISDGYAISGGGAVKVESGNLTLADCTIANSAAAGDTTAGFGGGVYNVSGAALVL